MIRPLIVAASVLASMPAYASDVLANCRPIGDVVSASADNPNAPQRLVGDDYAAVLEVFNAIPPESDYDGPLWLKVMGRSVLMGGLNPDVPGHICFYVIPAGAIADRILQALQPT